MMDSMVIAGRSVPFERRPVRANEVHLDPKNPRIQYLVGRLDGNVTEEQLDSKLWEKHAVRDLANSIKQNGGVYEPILVQRRNGKLVVREGNCRTVGSRHLMEMNPGDTRFEKMPAMIFDVDLTEEDVAIVLADMHVANKIRWAGFEQARHIHSLHNQYNKSLDWLADHLRLSKSRITQDLAAYSATDAYLKLHPEPANLDKFAFFQELMRKKKLKEKFDTDINFKQQFNRWITEGKLSASVQVRDLEEIIANDEATKALDETGYDAAHRVLVREDPALASDMFSAVRDATEQLKEAPASDIHDLKTNPQKLIMLRNLKRALEDIATLAGVAL